MEKIIQEFLINLLIALGGLASAYITLYISKAKAKAIAETNKLNDEKQKALINSAIERVNDLVSKGVDSAQQTLVDDLKRQIASGTATKEDLIKIGKNVAENVYNQLSEETVNVLQTEINDVQKYIIDTVESQVLKIKSN